MASTQDVINATATRPSVVDKRIVKGRVQTVIINQLDLFDGRNEHRERKFNLITKKWQLTKQWWHNLAK